MGQEAEMVQGEEGWGGAGAWRGVWEEATPCCHDLANIAGLELAAGGQLSDQ